MSEARSRLKIGVLGCGNMGSALVKGLVEHSFYPQNIHVFDTEPRKIASLRKEIPVKHAKSNRRIASVCEVVVLAVKPSAMDGLLNEIALCTPRTTLVISVAAGVRIAALQKAFKERVPVIRVMPNMPALIGEGMSAYACGSTVEPRHEKTAESILKAIGESVRVKEELLDLVTAVSGSGPAYFFLLAGKLIEAACELGMKAEVAKKLVIQTALGSAKTLAVSGDDPETLIAKVASKGGTTEAALKIFQRKGFGKVVLQAVEQAYKRAKELT